LEVWGKGNCAGSHHNCNWICNAESILLLLLLVVVVAAKLCKRQMQQSLLCWDNLKKLLLLPSSDLSTFYLNYSWNIFLATTTTKGLLPRTPHNPYKTQTKISLSLSYKTLKKNLLLLLLLFSLPLSNNKRDLEKGAQKTKEQILEVENAHKKEAILPC
jgi:hypothetical protein